MKFVERLLVGLETRPWDMAYRAAIGFATLFFAPRLRMRDGTHSEWMLVPILLAVFLALRVVPAVVRKLAPFSDTVQSVWDQRRQMAKHYDSYQWQKLLGFGIGLTLCTVLSGQYSAARVVVPSVCLVCGTAGAIRWRAISRQIDALKFAKRATISG
ncbi:MAG: hypothetical protein LAO24_04300 [Acidobacteriia bacterium]|nr:hypothetical protein [Terriglobia bacterium]